MQQPLASFWIVEQGLQTLTKGRHVPQRSLEGDEGLAQLQQAVQLGLRRVVLTGPADTGLVEGMCNFSWSDHE